VKRLLRKECGAVGYPHAFIRSPLIQPIQLSDRGGVAHDNSLIAMGSVAMVAAEAAAGGAGHQRRGQPFPANQLPELYGGLQRDPTSFPCSISAPTCRRLGLREPIHAAAGDVGLQQDGAGGKLYVDPALPDWLPDVTLTDLRLGVGASTPLLAGGRQTQWKVLKGIVALSSDAAMPVEVNCYGRCSYQLRILISVYEPKS